MDEIASTINKHGVLAVNRYREISGLPHSGVPELFLGGIIAGGLHDDLGFQAHVERNYDEISRELGILIPTRITERRPNFRADVALYKSGKPYAIVELKKFIDYSRVDNILADSKKMDYFAAGCRIRTYLGVFVTATVGRSCDERAQEVMSALEMNLEVSAAQLSHDGSWDWCFASGATTSLGFAS